MNPLEELLKTYETLQSELDSYLAEVERIGNSKPDPSEIRDLTLRRNVLRLLSKKIDAAIGTRS